MFKRILAAVFATAAIATPVATTVAAATKLVLAGTTTAPGSPATPRLPWSARRWGQGG